MTEVKLGRTPILNFDGVIFKYEYFVEIGGDRTYYKTKADATLMFEILTGDTKKEVITN